jgi:hypothetical protein
MTWYLSLDTHCFSTGVTVHKMKWNKPHSIRTVETCHREIAGRNTPVVINIATKEQGGEHKVKQTTAEITTITARASGNVLYSAMQNNMWRDCLWCKSSARSSVCSFHWLTNTLIWNILPPILLYYYCLRYETPTTYQHLLLERSGKHTIFINPILIHQNISIFAD